MSLTARCLSVGLWLFLSGCSGPAVHFTPEHGVHIVQRGETLYSIAMTYDMDWRDLASRNGIRPPYTLYIGQRLLLAEKTGAQDGAVAEPAPKSIAKSKATPLPPVGKIVWSWPTEGRMVTTFAQGHLTRKGIDIVGELGQPVRAAASGEVVYSGSGLAGYGKLIILKHDEHFLSAYAYNQALLVSEGETVQRGQIIARMGQAEVGKPMLHFEIRLDGRPIDPLQQLPQRGH